MRCVLLGLFGGLAISVFSKPLAILIGLFVVGSQVRRLSLACPSSLLAGRRHDAALAFFADNMQALQSSTGINMLPVNRLQRMFDGTSVRGMLQDDVALKLSFGITFLLAGFAKF